MDEQKVVYYLGVAAYGVLGFFIRRLIGDYDKLKKRVDENKELTMGEIAKIRDNYVKYEEFVRFQTAIDGKLTKIYDILVGR